MKLKRFLLFERKAMKNLHSILKSRDITLLTKICIVKAMNHPIVMYRCESWTVKKNEIQRIDAFELWCWEYSWEALGLQRDISSPSLMKSILNIHWRTDADAEAEAPRLWPPDVKNWLIRKGPDAGKDWRQKRRTEDEMVGWHHQLDKHEFELPCVWVYKASGDKKEK